MTTPINQPVDQIERERALDTNSSFAVSAPAGSGKTGLLTQRVLALLAQCDEPENVLAITFTRKAAAEMQARILDALRDAEQQHEEPEADYEKATWRLARAALKQNEDKGWELFSCPNRLRITTIDSLCRSLSQQMPFESQLGHTPEILDNVNTAYQMAARETLKELNKKSDWQEDLIRLVKHFDNKLEQIEKLFIQLLAKRDQWLSIIFQTKDQRTLLESMLTEVIEDHLSLAQKTLAPISSELAILADHAANNLGASSSPINTCLGLQGLPNITANSLPQWIGLAELLLTQKGELRKSATKAIGFFAPSDRSLSSEQKTIAKEYKLRIGELFNQCKDIPELENIVHQLRHLPTAHYPEKQWQLLNSLTNILISLASNLTIAFQQLGKTDYLAITLAALDALGEPDSPTDLALALDYKIQHILVDEFQDTSTTQLELLQRLTAGWQTDDGRTLFVVGDAMQSCYRFRDANVGIFLDVREHGVGDIELEPLDLQVNFRSQQGIVDWVNHSFTHIFPTEDNSHRGAVSYSPSTSFNDRLNIPAVKAHLLAYQDPLLSRKDEASTIVDIIQEVYKTRTNDSIAILVRSKAHAQSIIPTLAAHKIEYQANDIDRLDTCMPVLDVLSLTKALLYPNDRIAWLSVLRAPWCGLDMYDLHALAQHNKTSQNWPSLVNTLCQYSNDNNIPLSPKGHKKLSRFSQIINDALAQQKRLPLRHWIQGIWLALGGAGLLLNPEDENNIITFFNLLDRYEQGGSILVWQDVEKAVNELYAKPKAASNTNNVVSPIQIMTIHKSKGLEFDTVIIPSLEKKPRGNDKELLIWLERVGYSRTTHQQERQLLISPVNAMGDDKDPIYQFIQQQHTEKEQLESDRVLYVGCTRAIKQLHLVGYVSIDEKKQGAETIESNVELTTLKEPAKHSLLNRLWGTIQQSKPEHIHIVPTQQAHHYQNDNRKLSHPNYIASLCSDWRLPVIAANDLLSAYRGNNILAKSTLAKTVTIQNDLFSPTAPESKTPNELSENERTNIAKPDALIQRDHRYIGTVIHLAFQQITETGHTTWTRERIQQQRPIWRAQLIQKGINSLRINDALHTVEQAVTQTLHDTIGQWLLDNTHQESATELELWDSKGQHIIDRTFVETKEGKKIRWIIDYKSSQPSDSQTIEIFAKEQQEQYKNQLSRYRSLFSDKDVKIQTALYFPLLALFLEV